MGEGIYYRAEGSRFDIGIEIEHALYGHVEAELVQIMEAFARGGYR